MSRKIDGGRDPETMKHIFIKQGDTTLELVMPPMDKQAKLDKIRCTRYLLDMLLKYGPAIQAKKENGDSLGDSI